MTERTNRPADELEMLSRAEMEQIHGGADDELSTPVDDPQSSGGTVIPIKIKHNA